MANVPTAKASGRYILRLFVEHFNSRAGHVLRVNNFIGFFARAPWQSSDFTAGMEYAAEQGWVEILKGGYTFRLTEAGFEAAGKIKEVDFEEECKDLVTVERKDGTRHENVPALVTNEMVFIPDTRLPIDRGDAILRKLPSNIVERLIVRSPGFQSETSGFDAHYQVAYEREGEKPAGSPGYVIHASGNAQVNIQSTDNSSTVISYAQNNIQDASIELEKLRLALAAKATSPEQYTAIGHVASAESAAKENNATNVHGALSKLGAAGRWVLDTAKDIGTKVAAELIIKSMGQ